MNPRVACGSTVLAVCCAVITATAQEKVQDDELKARALQWLDRFAVEQVLFHADDVKQLRAKVASMPAVEAAEWWRESEVERGLFDSADWRETRQWLKEFLKVQAIYSDEQIRQLQSDAFAKAQESPRSLKEVMGEISDQRQSLQAGARHSAATRQMTLELNEAYRKEQVQARERIALRQANPPATPKPVAPPPHKFVTIDRS